MQCHFLELLRDDHYTFHGIHKRTIQVLYFKNNSIITKILRKLEKRL
jgi:hypothetical protein